MQTIKDPKYLSSELYYRIFEAEEGYFINHGVIESTNRFHFLCDELNPEDREDGGQDVEPSDTAYYNVILTFDRANRDEPAIGSIWNGYQWLKFAVQKGGAFAIDFLGQQIGFGGDNEDTYGKDLGSYVADPAVFDSYGPKLANYALVIIGDFAYIGIRGKVIKRIDDETFEELLVFDHGKIGDDRPIISHISGLSETDFCFVADNESVYHFDGKVAAEMASFRVKLQKNAFHRHPVRDGAMNAFANAYPENRDETITALFQKTADEVYVGTSLGRLFKWEENQWEEIPTGALGPKIVYPIKRIVSSHGRLFLVSGFHIRAEIIDRTSTIHLWEVANNLVVLAKVPEEVHRFAEDIDTKEGLVLISGKAGAVLWDGTDWELLIDKKGYEEATAN